MTAAGRQDATGGASAVELFAAITDPTAETCQVNGTVTGWVFSRNFTITVDPGTTAEEKMLCSEIVGENPATITIVERGYDDTVPTTHGQGAIVTHTLPAAAFMDFERHGYDTTEDDHTQYHNTERHATPTNHEYGTPAEFFAYGAGETEPADVGTVAAAGGGANPARDDHIHAIGSGAVASFAMVSSSLLGLDADIAPLGGAADSGVASKFARADHVHNVSDASITYAKLVIADDAISGAKLTDATVPLDKIVWGPYGRLSLSGQSPTVAAATLTVMNFATTDYDDDNIFGSATRFTVPAGFGGVWSISSCLSWPLDGANPAAITRRYIGLRVNGSTIIDEQSQGSVGSPSGVGTATSVKADHRLAVADYVEVICRQDSAGTLTFGSSTASHFSATFIRPT